MEEIVNVDVKVLSLGVYRYELWNGKVERVVRR